MIAIAGELMFTSAALGFLMLLCLIRAIKGPTTPDRVVAADTANTLGVAAIVLLGVAFEELIYIDIAIIYAMLSFVSTLYVARYLEGKS